MIKLFSGIFFEYRFLSGYQLTGTGYQLTGKVNPKSPQLLKWKSVDA